MKTSRAKFWIPVLALIALALAAIPLMPWKAWIESRLIGAMEAQGLAHVQLNVEQVGWDSLTLADITFGDPAPLKNLTLGYSLKELWGGKLRDISLSGLEIEARHEKGRWTVTGLETWQAGSSGGITAVPVAADQLAALPFDSITVNDSRIRMSAELWRMDIPLSVTWRRQPAPAFSAQANSLSASSEALQATAGAWSLKATLDADKGTWQGPWQINAIALSGTETAVPPLTGKGTVTARADHIAVEGNVASADKTTTTSFRFNLPLQEGRQASLTLGNAKVPWHGGTLGAKVIRVPLGDDDSDVTLDLDLAHVSIEALMQQLTGKKATATGVISGTIPVTLKKNGDIIVREGKLLANEPGTLALAPDAIPGDNAQVAFARDVLKNFHYDLLSVTVSNDQNRLAVLLKLQGNNPDVQAGRPVNLNVQITGDVMDFVQQNMLSLTNPQKFLEKGDYGQR